MNRLLAALLLLAFVALNLRWLDQDRMVRDGDEEGHVGAAELFLGELNQHRWDRAVEMAVVEDMGDYPALYPATVGAWWWGFGGGQPGRPGVRAVNLLFLLAAAGAVAGTASRLGANRDAALLGGAVVLWLPLNVGLARHFMPEGALVAAVAFALWVAARDKHPAGFGLGLALALGLLTKQTFPLFLAPLPLLVRRSGVNALPLAVGAALAVPWYAMNLREQWAYAEMSTAYAAPVPWTEHALYYPRELAHGVLGPVWLGVLAIVLLIAMTQKTRPMAIIGGVWLLASLAVLTLIPKKYDRLLAPALPAAGLFVAAALTARPKLGWIVLPGVAWTAWTSLEDSAWNHPTDEISAFHPGCVQRWLRPPDPRSWGFEVVANAVLVAPEGAVRVLDGPEIPCAIQTTFPWADHLGPYLRREGLDRPIVDGSGEGRPALTVDFSAGARGERYGRVEPLEQEFTIRAGR